ncbi:hypothetical protein Tco_1514703 [Tanacetum coccineum]
MSVEEPKKKSKRRLCKKIELCEHFGLERAEMNDGGKSSNCFRMQRLARPLGRRGKEKKAMDEMKNVSRKRLWKEKSCLLRKKEEVPKEPTAKRKKSILETTRKRQKVKKMLRKYLLKRISGF